MYFRPFLLAVALTTALTAQEKSAPPDAKGQQPQPGTAQKGDQPAPATDKPAPREQTPAEQKAKLEAEIERLQKEIAFTKARKGTFKTTIAEKLAHQSSTFEPKKINAGTSRAAMPAAAALAPRKAKVLTAGETSDLGDGMLLAVNGRPVKQADFDELVAYLKSVPFPGSDKADGATKLPENFYEERAIRELIQLEAANATFAKEAQAAAEKAKELSAALQKGGDFAELAKGTPSLVGDQPGAVFTVTRTSPFGPILERMAFTTKPGMTSQVFRMPLGYAIVRVEKFQKGEQPQQDRADVRLLLVPFGPLEQVRQVPTTMAQGQLDILLKDEKTRQLLPIQFR